MSTSKRPPAALGEFHAEDSTAKVRASDGHVPRHWLMALGEGELPETQRDHVMAHLVECEACRKAVPSLDATVRFDPNVSLRPAVKDHESLIGTMLGEYRVEALLDEGAMGVVYRGVHPVIGKSVAIKVMQRDFANDAENKHRLVAEARAVNAIGHPNIVDVFSFGALPDGRQYLVMELLTGQNLRMLGRAQAVSLNDALDILLQVSAALAAAHAAGVVHRDLKPSNLFISRHLGALHVTVLDFGVAKTLNANSSSVLTTPGVMIGTAGFMAPEQITGREVGPPADVYALGCVAWWLLTRAEVFSAKSENDLYRLHVEAQPPLVSTRARVPPALDALVNAMLAKAAAARPTAADVQQRLSRLIAEQRTALGAEELQATEVRRPLPRVVEPVLAATTVPEMPAARASPAPLIVMPAPNPQAEETLKPPSARGAFGWAWIVAALLAGGAITFMLLKLLRQV